MIWSSDLPTKILEIGKYIQDELGGTIILEDVASPELSTWSIKFKWRERIEDKNLTLHFERTYTLEEIDKVADLLVLAKEFVEKCQNDEKYREAHS